MTDESVDNLKADDQPLINVEAKSDEETIAPDDAVHVHAADEDEIRIEPPESKDETAKERPENIPTQFWDSKEGSVAVDKLAEAYSQLRKKMDSGKHKAPKNGKYDFSGVGVEIPEDDEALTAFQEIAADEGISQGAAERRRKFSVEQQGISAEEQKYARSAEVAKLGRHADRIMQNTENWLTKMNSSGVINGQELEALADASNRAEVVVALNKIRRSYNEQNVPTVVESDASAPDMVTIESAMQDARYGKDMAYTRKVERMVYELNGENYPT